MNVPRAPEALMAALKTIPERMTGQRVQLVRILGQFTPESLPMNYIQYPTSHLESLMSRIAQQDADLQNIIHDIKRIFEDDSEEISILYT